MKCVSCDYRRFLNLKKLFGKRREKHAFENTTWRILLGGGVRHRRHIRKAPLERTVATQFGKTPIVRPQALPRESEIAVILAAETYERVRALVRTYLALVGASLSTTMGGIGQTRLLSPSKQGKSCAYAVPDAPAI